MEPARSCGPEEVFLIISRPDTIENKPGSRNDKRPLKGSAEILQLIKTIIMGMNMIRPKVISRYPSE
jgi:hypothetical protein